MSGDAGGATPANIFITTNDASFQEFLKRTIEGMKELEKEGKKTFKSLGDEMKDFVKVSLGAAFIAAGKDFAETVAEPFNTTFKGATDAARDFRRENTRIAVAVGQDWRQVGAELDELSVKTRRAPEQIRTYAEQVRGVTGSWKTATEGVETYSKLATYLGKKSVEELAPFAAEMENTFGIRGKAASEDFFNALIAKAEKLGQSGQMAVAIWQRVAGAVGKESVRGEAGQKIAAKDAAMVPALMRMGYSPEESQQIMGKLGSFFSGDLQWMERHMRAYGQLGKKEKLRDKYGRLTHSLPDMLARLRRTELARVGGREDRLQQRLQQDQNLGPLVGSFITQLPEFGRHYTEGQGASASKPLDAAKILADATPEGQRQAEENLRKLRDRQQVGDPTLKAQDAASSVAPGGQTGITQNYGLKGIGLATVFKGAEHLLGRLGLGRAAGVASKANPLLQLAAITTMSGDNATPVPKGLAEYYGRMTPQQRTATLTSELEGMRKMGGRGPYGGYQELIQAANPQLAKDQAKAFADKLKEGEPVPVIVRSLGLMPTPLPGGGEQHG